MTIDRHDKIKKPPLTVAFDLVAFDTAGKRPFLIAHMTSRLDLFTVSLTRPADSLKPPTSALALIAGDGDKRRTLRGREYDGGVGAVHLPCSRNFACRSSRGRRIPVWTQRSIIVQSRRMKPTHHVQRAVMSPSHVRMAVGVHLDSPGGGLNGIPATERVANGEERRTNVLARRIVAEVGVWPVTDCQLNSGAYCLADCCNIRHSSSPKRYALEEIMCEISPAVNKNV